MVNEGGVTHRRIGQAGCSMDLEWDFIKVPVGAMVRCPNTLVHILHMCLYICIRYTVYVCVFVYNIYYIYMSTHTHTRTFMHRNCEGLGEGGVKTIPKTRCSRGPKKSGE